MRALSSVGVGLSLVSGCLFLALVAELYYLFWWKKRRSGMDMEDKYISPAKAFLDLFCCKKPSFLSSTALNPRSIPAAINGAAHGGDGRLQFHSNCNGDLLLKPFGDHQDTMEAELMMLAGPPKLLFTIKEETKEDLESNGGKSRKSSRGKSLGDLLLSPDTPFLTPLSSPPIPSPPPITHLDFISQNGFNPLFECSRDDDLSRMWTSPPPTFKFLRDAEEKLFRKTLMEEAFKVQRNGGFVEDATKKEAAAPANSALPLACPQQGDGSFITLLVGRNRDSKGHHQQHSSSSQVIPAPSSPLSTGIASKQIPENDSCPLPNLSMDFSSSIRFHLK